jgi:outer membrane protein OmpA-like peptidoglycan-associated protein
MQNSFWQYVALLFFITMVITGCGGTVSQEVQQAVSDARANYQVVESLEVEDTYLDDYREARDKLFEAEKYLESDYNKDKALPPARQSLSASQRILKHFYRSTITPLARTAKAEIEKITEEDPDSPLQDFLPTLNELLDYSEKIESGEQEVVALSRVIEDLEDVINIKHNVDKDVKTTLGSDVSFDTGKYELSDNGKQILKEFFERIIAEQKEELGQYIGKTVTMKIKVVGYTDQQGFRKGTNLVKVLLEGVEEEYQALKQPVEKRKFLNQRLSLFRARTIGEYIRQIIAQADPRIYIEQEIVGRGEEVPPGVPPSQQRSDPRRRICKIYSYVIAK